MAEETQTKILEIQLNYEKAIEGIADYDDKIRQVTKSQDDLRDALKKGSISQKEFDKEMAASKVMAKQLKTEQAALVKQVQQNVKAENSAQNSLVQLRAKLSNLTAEYDRLSGEMRNGDVGKALQEEINGITAEIKGAEEGTERFYRNVGNYPNAVAPLSQQLRELTQQLQQMALNGEKDTEEFRNLSNQAAAMRDAIADVNQGINNLASDSQKIDAVKQGTQGVINAFVLWKSASAALGVENESLDKIMAGMTASMAALNAIQAINNALQEQSALMKGVNAVKTWVLTKALGAQAVATTAVAGAETGATGATIAWNAALYANPLMWLIGIIMAAVAAIAGLVKAFQWFTSSTEDQKRALQEASKELDKFIEANRRLEDIETARGKSSAYVSKLRMDNLVQEYKIARNLLDEYKKLYDLDDDEYKNQLEKTKEIYKSANEQAYKNIDMLYQRYHEIEKKIDEDLSTKEEIRKREIEHEYNEYMDLANAMKRYGQITLAQYNEFVAQFQEGRRLALEEARKETEKEEKEAAKKRADDAKKAVEAARAKADEERNILRQAEDAMLALVKVSAEKRRTQVTIQYKREIEELRIKLERETALSSKARQALNDIILAKEQQLQNELAEIDKSISEEAIRQQQEEISLRLEIVAKGSEDELNLKIEQNDLKRQADLEAAEKEIQDAEALAQRKQLINAKYDAQEDALRKERDKKLQEEVKLRMQNDFDEAMMQASDNSVKQAELELEQRKAELDNLHQMEGESDEEFRARQLAAEKNYIEAQKKLTAKENEVTQTRLEVGSNVAKGLASAFDALGESNKAFAKMGKVLALAEIAINTGKALAAGIAQAQSVPYPANLAAIGTTTATILGNVASAISTVKSAKFANGGKVEERADGGKVNGAGTGTSDSIPAMLSNGEFVMTAAATRIFEPILAQMNAIGRGVVPQVSRGIVMSNASPDSMTESFAASVREIQPVVSVVDINDGQRRVNVIDNLDTI